MFFSLEHIILFKDVDINFSSSRAGIKAQESMALYQTKNWVYTTFLVGRRMKFFGNHESIFALKTLKKWFWWWSFWGSIPRYHVYNQFTNLNFLVHNSSINHELVYFARSDYRKYDMILLNNHARELYQLKFVKMFESQYKYFVLYRERPFAREILTDALAGYRPAVDLATLNPGCVYFDEGLLYARKWVVHVYMVFSKSRIQPFSEFGYWTSNYFSNFYIFTDFLYYGKNEYLNDFFEYFYDTNFLNVFWFFLIFYLFYFYFILLFLFIEEEKFFEIAVPAVILIVLYRLSDKFIVVFTAIKKQIRVDRTLHRKEYGMEITRRKDFESSFLKFLNKYLFRKISVFFIEWVRKINIKYFNKFKNGDYTIFDCYILIPFFFLYYIYRFFIAPRSFYYYAHYFYYLALPKRFKNVSHNSFRTRFSFMWFGNFVMFSREYYQNTAFDAVKNFINYVNFYRKDEYKIYLREKIIKAYEAKMWGVEVDEERKEEYINYYFYKIFYSYYPDNDFFYFFFPRFLSKIAYRSDFSFHKFYTSNFPEFFNLFHNKFILISSKKRFVRFVFLRYFFSYNFWVLYFYYFYMLYADKLNKFDSIVKIYFLYSYTTFMHMFSLWHNIISIILTKKILIYYFFKRYMIFLFHFFNNFIIFFIILKFFSIIVFIFFLLFFIMKYFYQLIYAYLYQFYYSVKDRLFNLSYYLFVSDRGYSYKFWYKYYIFKFYVFEYNFFLHIFIFIINFFFNLLILVFMFYIFFSLPIINNIFFSEEVFTYFYAFSEKFYVCVKYLHLKYSINYWNFFLIRNSSNFNGHFNVLVNYFDMNFAYFFHDWRFESRFGHTQTFLAKYGPYEELLYEAISDMEDRLMWGRIPLAYVYYKFFPNIPPWWLYFIMHLYFKITKNPLISLMPDWYWINLPVIVSWFWGLKYYSVFSFFMFPIAWFLNHFYSFIVFHLLYWTYNTFLYYIFFFLLKNIYSIYLFMVYKCFYLLYYYYYYKFWLVFSDYFYEQAIFHELPKYSSLRFLIALDFYNIFRLCLDSFIFIINNSIVYFFVNLYKLFANFLSIIGFNFFGSFDYFSLNILPEFRPFTINSYNIILPSNFDFYEYNSLFYDHAHNRAGVTRRYYGRHHKINPFLVRFKLKSVAFEFVLRAALVADGNYLTKLAFNPNLISYRSTNLIFFTLPSYYAIFFLSLVVFSILYIKIAYYLKEYRYYYNSATFEWQTFTFKQKRNLLTIDEFYWLYNIRWLRSFEFYWDKWFQDDFFARYGKHEDVTGFFIVNELNEMLLQSDKDHILNNTYFRLRRYYYERYLLFIKDIDYLFRTFSVRKEQLKRRQGIYKMFDFFFPLLKKKNSINYALQYSFLTRIDRMDYFWLHFMTTYFFKERNHIDTHNFSNHVDLYKTLKKSLFKAYALFEMNQKEFPFDLFEFQFFETDFIEALYENFSFFDNQKNTILRQIIYSRFNTVLLYNSPNNIVNHFGIADFTKKANIYFNYLDKLNKTYFNGIIDFSLFSFIGSFANVHTNISPNIAKTAVDVDRGDLIGVSYKKSLLLDEFTSTEITEQVFSSVDRFFVKSKFNNIDLYKVLLKEEGMNSTKPVSMWWLILAMIPFYIFYIELDYMFKYGRFITPHGNIIELYQYIVSHLFNERLANKIISVKYFSGDHINWTKKLKYQMKPAHFRALAWEIRWMDLASRWTGKNSHLFESKFDYAWFLFRLNNDYGGYYRFIFTQFNDFYIRFVLSSKFLLTCFSILKFLQFLLYCVFTYTILSTILFLYNLSLFVFFEKINAEGLMKQFEESKKERGRTVFEELDEQLKKHRETVDFIIKYKKEQEEKKERDKDRKEREEWDKQRDIWGA
jgi:hypothetical protein